MGIIEGERVGIRPLMPDDLRCLLELKNENRSDSERKSIEDIRLWYNGIQEDTTKSWFIITKKGGMPIGEIGYTQRNAERTDINLIRLGREYRNKGYGTDAMKAFSTFLFSNTDTSYILVFVESGNGGAIRCYEKCGFRREAVRKARNSEHETMIMILENPDTLTEVPKVK